jgi:filamentous hemagglutinin family protein
MNRTHNVIWSKSKNAFIVVAEGTNSCAKSGVRGLKIMIALILLSPGIGMSATLPQGGVISVGEGTIVNTNNNTLTIKQSTDKLGVNWQSFNVGADGQVVFEQPNSKSVALNRVVGSDGSAIQGKIDANGQVIIVNPNGVIFGKDAQVNVGGLVASTLNITDENFKSGSYTFKEGATTGEVLNLGKLEAAEGGYVALLGKSVKNHGIIKAKLGTAALAAGSAVTLDFAGDGLINVQVDKSTVNALVDNKGLIQADGGQVLMTARASNALLNTVVNNDGIVQAQTIGTRNGKIFLDGGMDSGTVTVAGTLDASAPVTGNGGFIETSGANVKIANGTKVTTQSKKGKTGSWLVDPTDFNVVAGNGPQSASQIGADTLQSNLATTNVTLQTSPAENWQNGNINIAADVSWSADTKLTLIADRTVNFYASVTATGTNAGIAINAPLTYDVIGQNGGRIRLPGANSTFSVNGVNYTLIRTADDLALLSNATDNQHFALANDIDASVTSTWNGGKGYIPPGGSSTGFIDGLVLDGFNNSITQLTINHAGDYAGLVGKAKNASIGNLHLDANVNGLNYTGMVAGFLQDSEVYRVTLTGSVNGADNVGGFVGWASNLEAYNLGSYASVAGTNNVGGGIGSALGSTVIWSNTEGLSITGLNPTSANVGGFFGYVQDSWLQGIYSSSNVVGGTNVGGIIGYSNNIHLDQGTAIGSVTGTEAVGGFIGKATGGSLDSTYSTGQVIGQSKTGGYIGEADNLDLSNSYATGKVDGLDNTGGLIGESTDLNIEKSYATGNVNGTANTGGLIGHLSGGTINQAFTTGQVTGSDYVGGFVGRDDSGSINNAYASGSVSGNRYVGGFFGAAETSVVKFTYSIGLVSGSLNYGGYSGFGTGNTISESFWDKQTSGQLASVDGLGKTTTQMHAASTFANWNIGSEGGTGEIWRIYDGFTGPLMRYAMTTATVSANDKTLTYSGHAVTEDELDAGSPYGYSTSADPGWYWVAWNKTRADVDLESIFGGNTYGGGLAIRNAGTYTADKFYSTQFGYDIIETAPKTIVINKANLSVSATGNNKIYDGTANAGATFTDNRIGTDSLVIGSTSSTFNNKNVGTGKSINISGITVTGADAGNYTWNTTATTTADVAKAALTVSATGVNRAYDGTSAAGATLSDNRFGSDVLTVTSTAKAFSDKNAGTGKAVLVSGINVTGADAGNYTWNTSAVTTADITKAALTITAAGVNKTYDGTTGAAANLADNRIGGDLLVVSAGTKTFSSKNAGVGKTLTVGGITVTGADASNYSWNTTATTTADIAKASLNITATGINKTYDGLSSAGVSFNDDRLGADALNVSASISAFSNKNAGIGKTITVGGISVTGADSANYSWNSTATTFADITKAALNITASGVNKTYDGTTSASATLSDNRFGADLLVVSAAGKTFADKNAGVGKAINVTGITVTGADAGNYTWNTSTTTAADITKAALNVTATGVNKTYDGTTTAGVSLADNRVGSDSLIVSSSTQAFSDKNAGLGKAITVSGITVTGSDAGNYSWNTSALTSADIAKAALTVSASGIDKTYDGTTSAGANLSDNRIGADDLTLSATGKTFSDKNAGTGKTITVSGINVTGADAGNYTWNGSALTVADITKAALNITAAGVDKTYDGTTAATANLSDNRIGADLLVVSVAGKTFADKNAGAGKAITVSGINVTGADAGNYTWNTSAITSANIAKAALTVTAAGVNKTYDGTTDASANLSDNRIGSDVLVLSSAGNAFEDKNAGTAKAITVSGISVAGLDAGNYTWNTTASTTADITKAALNVTASGVNKTYDGTATAGVSLTDNRIGLDDLVISSTSNAFSDKNAGIGKAITVNGINVTGADAGNYSWNTSAATTADIAKAALTVTASGIDKTYDGTAVATASLSDNRIGSDVLVLSSAGQAFVDKNAGAGKTITVSGINVTGVDAGNYAWNTSAVTSADIAKAALSVTASGVDKTYDGTSAATANLSDNRIGSDLLVVSVAGKTFADKNAGIGKTISVNGIDVTGADAGNYTWNTSATTTADITKAALNVTAVGVDKTYDGTTAAGASLSDNRIGSDSLVVSSTDQAFSDKNAGFGKTITVNGITVTGADAGNYSWNTTAATSADISKAALTVTASGVDKTYDGTAAAGANLSDNRIGADVLTVSATSKSFSDKNAGTGKAITVTGINVTGADSGNYTWNTSASTAADITKAALNVTATGLNKVYDGTTTAGANLADDRIGSDVLVVSAAGKAFGDKNAGTGKAVTVSGINVTGIDAGNYIWNTTAATTADITKAALNVTATGANKTYDGTASANATLSDDRIGSDVLVLSAAGKAFADKNAGTGKSITVSGIDVMGADAGNYTWNTTALTSADIAKAALTLTATGLDKTYDGTTSASVTLSDNRVALDDLAITSAGAAFADKNAGMGKAISVIGLNVTGIDSGNYTWNTTAATSADIAKAALTVTASGVNKTYDGNTIAGVNLSDNRIGADVLAVAAASSTFADKNAGASKAVTVTGINVTGADAANYTWNTTASTAADIAKAALTVTATGTNKTYDGNTLAGVVLADNRIGADDLVLDATSKTFADKNAGLAKTISVSGINVTGADAGNYTWNTSALAAGDITKAALNITATGVDKTYDGTTGASVTLGDNRIGSDLLTVSSGSQAFADKNAGIAKAISVSGLNVTGADAGNYTWNTAAVTSADIVKAALTVTASGIGKTYDGTTGASVNLSDDRLGSDSLILSSTGSAFADKNAGIAKVIGVNGISVTGADAGNYTWNTTAATTADIAKAALTVTATGQSKTYDGTNSAGATLADNRIGSDDLVLSSSSNLFADKNVGLAKTVTVSGINVTGADAGNYTWNSAASTSASISKATLNITASGHNKTYDGTASAGTSLADNRLGSDDLVISSSSSVFADKNVGISKAITVSGLNVTGVDAGNYSWNTTASSSADITKAALNVSATGVSKTYDGTTTADAVLSDDRIVSDDLVVSSTSKNFSDKNAGVGKVITVNGIAVTGADANNYTWNTTAITGADIAKAALNVTANGVTKVYDGTTNATVTLNDDRIGSDSLVLSATGKNFSDKNAGIGKSILVNGISVSGIDSANYTWNTSTATSADITKAALNVTASGVNKTYDGTTAAGVNLTDDRIGSDNLVINAASHAFSDKNAGTGKAISVSGISVSGADAGNYTWNAATSTVADISKAALTVTASGISKVYDGSTVAGANLSDDRIGGDVLVLGATSKTFNDKNAGAGKGITVSGINVTGVDAANYTWNTTATTAADITKAALNVTATGVSKTYDGNNTATVMFGDDRIGADALVIGAGNQAFADKNAGAGKSISISGITVTGADAANYTWNASTATSADITKAALNVTAIGIGKTYDGTTAANIVLNDDRIGADDLTVSVGSKAFSDKNAALGKSITVGGISVTGADSANYTWNTTTTTSADIAKAALNVTASGVNKTYDGTTAASVNLSDDRLGTDVLTVSAGSKTFADKNAGAGKSVNVGAITVTGADAGNYSWNTTASTSADITKAALNITASGIGKTYDGSTLAGVNFSDDRLGSDSLAINASSTFADKNAGLGKAITVNGISVTGADAGNYTWNTSAVTSADIAKAALNVTAAGISKVYDGNVSGTAILGDNRITADDLVLSSSSQTFIDKNAGLGKTLTVGGINVTGADAGNYVWNTSTTTTADITKAALNVTASGVSKTYDGTTSAGVVFNDDHIGSDLLVVNAVSKVFSDKNAGFGKTISVGGIQVTGADAGNYTWNATAMAFADVAKAALNITATGVNKTYDGTSYAAVIMGDNRKGSDLLVVNAASKDFSDKNAGTGKSIDVNGITVTGADAGNYTWNATTTTTANINKATLVVAATGSNKVYDSNTAASTLLSDNRFGADDLLVSAGSSVFADKNAGHAKSILVTGINVTGTDAGNYNWNSSTIAIADIAKAALNITATGVSKTYDGTTAASVVFADNRIGSDLLSVNAASKVFANKNAGTGKVIDVQGITLSGADAGNYSWNSSVSAIADIAKAALNVTAVGVNKTFDGTDLAQVNLGDNRMGSDLLDVNAATSQFIDADVGTGKTIQVDGITVSGADAGNYVWNTSTTAMADITTTVTPPVVTPPVVEPPVVTPPVVTPPVVTPPIDTGNKPPVPHEEETKAINAVTSVTSASVASVPPAPANDSSAVMSDFGLLNLGMKLPDDVLSDAEPIEDATEVH